ncbi:hypothetical protein GCM10022224_054560 [Nonomuraea antimicrobica]|uniref:Uncharacterized protein n=1 Tax=Nonomuraea antimicrobica TaxID=561173 RepID=A0ABP7CC90_9ACTN
MEEAVTGLPWERRGSAAPAGSADISDRVIMRAMSVARRRTPGLRGGLTTSPSNWGDGSRERSLNGRVLASLIPVKVRVNPLETSPTHERALSHSTPRT